MLPSLSIIVATYNWPQALKLVLNSIKLQNYPNRIEVIVADDGSSSETAELISALKLNFPFPLIHVWQDDNGFRAAKIRNKAIAKTSNDYLIFLDGDCIALKNFLLNHGKLAEEHWFVAGNRILLTENFTKFALANNVPIETWSKSKWFLAKLKAECNRSLPLLTLPLGGLRKLKPETWKGVKTCNLGVWREDLIKVNGLDEEFIGWGYEDSDLVIRLQKAGIGHKVGRFSLPIIHLWHKENAREGAQDNLARLYQTQQNNIIKAQKGLEQYL